MSSCYICHIEATSELFCKSSRAKSGFFSRCRKCDREYHAARYRADSTKYKNKKLRYMYGITLEQKQQMLDDQGGCALCGTNDPQGGVWCVDHNHVTGTVRGILCSPCNKWYTLDIQNRFETIAKYHYRTVNA